MTKRTSLKSNIESNFDVTKLLDLAKVLHEELNEDYVFIYFNGWSYHFIFAKDSETILCRSWETDVTDFLSLTSLYPCISCVL